LSELRGLPFSLLLMQKIGTCISALPLALHVLDSAPSDHLMSGCRSELAAQRVELLELLGIRSKGA
jgi:hypothetical protein